MSPEDMNKMMDDGDEIANAISAKLAELYGPEFLVKQEDNQFMIEMGALGYAINQIQSIVASLMIERFVAMGQSVDEAHQEVVNGMMSDAGEMADLGLSRFKQETAKVASLIKKKSTSH